MLITARSCLAVPKCQVT